MYLEMSPRRTGKTHRLVNEVLRYFAENKDGKIIVFSPNEMMRLSLEEKLNKYNISPHNVIFINSEYDYNRFLSPLWYQEINLLINYNALKLVVDEFVYCKLFMEKYKEICENFPKLVDNGIYVSTYDDNSVCYDLIRRNGGNYYTMCRNIGA